MSIINQTTIREVNELLQGPCVVEGIVKCFPTSPDEKYFEVPSNTWLATQTTSNKLEVHCDSLGEFVQLPLYTRDTDCVRWESNTITDFTSGLVAGLYSGLKITSHLGRYHIRAIRYLDPAFHQVINQRSQDLFCGETVTMVDLTFRGITAISAVTDNPEADMCELNNALQYALSLFIRTCDLSVPSTPGEHCVRLHDFIDAHISCWNVGYPGKAAYDLLTKLYTVLVLTDDKIREAREALEMSNNADSLSRYYLLYVFNIMVSTRTAVPCMSQYSSALK